MKYETKMYVCERNLGWRQSGIGRWRQTRRWVTNQNMEGEEWKVREMERENEERPERSTNLKESISPDTVIKSESQQTYPRLSLPFSLLYSHPFSIISCLSTPELSSHFSTPWVSESIFLFSACSSSPVPGQLPPFVFLSFQWNRVMVRPKRSLGGLGRVEWASYKNASVKLKIPTFP